MISVSHKLNQLIEAQLAGSEIDVPEELQAEFEQAMAAHGALQALLDETQHCQPAPEFRLPPDVSGKFEIEPELGRGGSLSEASEVRANKTANGRSASKDRWACEL